MDLRTARIKSRKHEPLDDHRPTITRVPSIAVSEPKPKSIRWFRKRTTVVVAKNQTRTLSINQTQMQDMGKHKTPPKHPVNTRKTQIQERKSKTTRITIMLPAEEHKQRKSRASTNSDIVPTATGAIFRHNPQNRTTILKKTGYACDALHDGRLMLTATLPVEVNVLFNMLFSASSKFLQHFHDMRNSTDLHMGEWKMNKQGLKERTVNVTIALDASIGPKNAKVTEHQTMRACSQPGQIYSIDVESVNEGIPYADVFSILLHFCLLRTADNNTEILVFAKVNFVKSTWAVIKAFIVKHSNEGLGEFYKSLHEQLLAEMAK